MRLICSFFVASVFALSLGSTFGVELKRLGLQPETTVLVQHDDEGFSFVDKHYFPDENDTLIMEAETHGSYPNKCYRKDPDASGGAALEDMVGRYFFRIETPGVYEFWARVRAPWPGYWVYEFEAQKAGEQATEQDVDGGSHTGFEGEGESGASMSLKGGLQVPKDADCAENFLYIKGETVRLEAGDYICSLRVPGEILVDQFFLVPPSTIASDPQKILSRPDGTPRHGRAEKALYATITFRPALPMDFGAFRRLAYEVHGELDEVAWFYRFPCKPNPSWERLSDPRDLSGLSVDGTGSDVLQLRVRLEREADSNARLSDVNVEYVADEDNILTLKSRSGHMMVSKLSGYWGEVATSAGSEIRSNSRASLPFSIKVIDESARAMQAIDDFRARHVELTGDDRDWRIIFDYVSPSSGINVSITGECDGSDRVAWVVSCENGSNRTVGFLAFPVLEGIQVGASPEDDEIAWLGTLAAPAYTLPGWKRTDPGELTFMDISDPRGGFYLGDHDATMLDGRFSMRPYQGKGPFDYRIEKLPTILPGETWESQPYIVAVHEGGWHNAVDRFYRPWYDAEMPRPKNPDWLVQEFSGYAQPVLCYKTALHMTEAWRLCRFHGWNYLKSFVTLHPGPLFNPLHGGFNEVKENATWINARGGQVDSYTEATWNVIYHSKEFAFWETVPKSLHGDFTLPSYKWRLAHQVVPLSRLGLGTPEEQTPRPQLYPSQRNARTKFDHQDPEVHEHFKDIAVHYAKAGMNLYWDCSGNTAIHPSYKAIGKHILPEYGRSMYARTLCASRMIEAARKYKDDFVICGENYNDRVMSAVQIPFLQAQNASKPFWDEVVRYTHPGHIFNVNLIHGGRALADRAFLFHSRISSSDIFNSVGFSTWLRARVYLRNMTGDIDTIAIYKSDVGLTVDNDAVQARYSVLSEAESLTPVKGRHLFVVNIINPDNVKDAVVRLRLPEDIRIRHAVAYTMEGRVAQLPFAADAPSVSFNAPGDRQSSIVLCAQEREDNAIRIFAMVPMVDECSPARIRVAIANLSDEQIEGTVKLASAPPLEYDLTGIPVTLSSGGALVRDIVVRNRDKLNDYRNVPVAFECTGGTFTTEVIVPPTIANGTIEDDVTGNAIADYWKWSVRDFAEPVSGDYCLAVIPKQLPWHESLTGGSTGSHYWRPRNAAIHLLPRTRYRLSFYYRHIGDTRVPGKVKVELRGSDERNRKTFSVGVRLSDSEPGIWHHKTMDFTTPEAVGKAELSIYNDNDSKGANVVWFDDVRIEPLR
ncbi:MAG: hypothetical protein K9N51_01975 [Candidatus Pacebacteria bacterium]|nr:hypothetical protein [Candidatus Paceibacterota bacterium]